MTDDETKRRALEEFKARIRGGSRQAQLDGIALQVVDSLGTAGVPSVLLKGPALARMLYLPGEHRGYSDIDLLVATRDLPKTRDILSALGWRNVSDAFGIDDVAGILHAESWYAVDDGRRGVVLVDLHWRLPGCHATADVVWEALAARRTSLDLAGGTASVLDREGLAFHVAIHAAQHGPSDLKAMTDLARAIERWPAEVWRSATRLAELVEATPAFAAGLRLSRTGSDLAQELGLPPTDELTWAIVNDGSRPRGTFHLQALGRAQGTSERLDVLRRSLLPKRRWIVSQYPWAAASNARIVAAYAAHLLRAPVWAVRAWRYRRRERRAGG